MQRPDAEHVVDLEPLLRDVEAAHEDYAGDGAHDQRADRVHHVGAGTDRDQPGQRAVMDEARVGPAGNRRRDDAVNHGEQRVERHEAGHPCC